MSLESSRSVYKLRYGLKIVRERSLLDADEAQVVTDGLGLKENLGINQAKKDK